MKADLLLVNGRIYTMDEQLPIAQAVAVGGGRVLAVGDDFKLREMAGPETVRIDLGGRCALPAFTDAHIHLIAYGLSLTQVQLDGVSSLGEAVARVGERARVTPPGEWIRGCGWNRNLWEGAPFPKAADLDAVTPDHPVLLRSKDFHAAWVNSRALEMAGLSAETADPPGGQLERDPETGQPTGTLKEDPAIDLVKDVAGPVPMAEMEEAARAAAERLHALGIVCVHVPEREHELAALQSLWSKGDLDLRVNFMLPDTTLDAAMRLGLRGGFGDEFLRLSAVKVYADGALGSRTADMFSPFDSEPDNRGIEVTTSEDLEDIIGSSTAGGWNVAVHAIGDRANSRVLDALEQHWPKWSELGLRPRIEHVQLIAPLDLPRLGTMGVVASMQPIHCTSDIDICDRHWGSRCSGAYAWRSLLENGTVLAFGSDAPVETPSVMQGIFAAVTRHRANGEPAGGWYPEQRLSVSQAVYAYTMGAAYAVGQERIQGSLSVGKLADVIVLSRDVFQVPARELLETSVQMTIVNGEVVYGEQ